MTNELTRRNSGSHLAVHPKTAVRRSDEGYLTELLERDASFAGAPTESFIDGL